jgi:hypothetical protein
MSLQEDLLQQADMLAHHETWRPRQSSLRRAVSAAYYALYHTLVTDAAVMLIEGGEMEGLRKLLERTFTHESVRDACRAFARDTLPPEVATARPEPATGLDDDVRYVADVFVDMQQARYEADEDTRTELTRSTVTAQIGEVREAMKRWEDIRRRNDARILLVSMLLWRSWHSR